jgi:glyoxylase I family protein
MGIEIRGLTPLLQVFDMPKAIAFYRDVLGFQIVGSDGHHPVPDNDWTLLELCGAQLMLNTAYEREKRPKAPVAGRIAAHQDTCIYFSCPDVDGTHKFLKRKIAGLKPPKVAPYGMKQLYLRDPDGYELCFQWRAEQTEQPNAG